MEKYYKYFQYSNDPNHIKFLNSQNSKNLCTNCAQNLQQDENKQQNQLEQATKRIKFLKINPQPEILQATQRIIEQPEKDTADNLTLDKDPAVIDKITPILPLNDQPSPVPAQIAKRIQIKRAQAEENIQIETQPEQNQTNIPVQTQLDINALTVQQTEVAPENAPTPENAQPINKQKFKIISKKSSTQIIPLIEQVKQNLQTQIIQTEQTQFQDIAQMQTQNILRVNQAQNTTVNVLQFSDDEE
ncbi:Hypothetical_protein [Hexamita inflata]|uniref:Hypothetical_protein n=1 Tax=Hexamita inflata TaxID=28002 RepID=A0AA86UBI7_9EUKA|nr:Hypothetical protein HINF_LOCUS32402 [Hexamita inflata]